MGCGCCGQRYNKVRGTPVIQSNRSGRFRLPPLPPPPQPILPTQPSPAPSSNEPKTNGG